MLYAASCGKEHLHTISFLAPFLLLPVVYLRMRESRDHAANLQGLLFCLIVPSTLILISAKLFGTVANAWEASLHVGSLPEGFLQYKLGKVIVNFLRTEVGFILAALICASTAVTVSQVKGLYQVARRSMFGLERVSSSCHRQFWKHFCVPLRFGSHILHSVPYRQRNESACISGRHLLHAALDIQPFSPECEGVLGKTVRASCC